MELWITTANRLLVMYVTENRGTVRQEVHGSEGMDDPQLFTALWITGLGNLLMKPRPAVPLNSRGVLLNSGGGAAQLTANSAAAALGIELGALRPVRSAEEFDVHPGLVSDQVPTTSRR